MVAIIETPAPRATQSLPVLTQWPVILGASEVLTTAKQVEVHRQTLLMQAAGGAVALLLPYLPVNLRVAVSIAKSQLLAVLVCVFDQQPNHFGKAALLASE